MAIAFLVIWKRAIALLLKFLIQPFHKVRLLNDNQRAIDNGNQQESTCSNRKSEPDIKF